MIRHAIQLLAPLATLAGLVLGVWGTYLLTHLYHPFSSMGFSASIWRVTCLLARFNVGQIIREAKVAAKLASVDEEDRARALAGVYLIFLGFVLQAGGTLLWLADTMMGLLAKPAAGLTGLVLVLLRTG